MSARVAAGLCTAYGLLAGTALAANWIPALGLIQAPSLQLGVSGVLLATGLALVRRFAKAALVLAATAAFWIPVAPTLLAVAGEESSGAVTIRLALLQTSNAAAVAYVLQTKPDIVVIADPSSPKHDRSAELAKAYPEWLALSAGGGPIFLARQGVDLQPMAGLAPDLLRAHVALDGASLDLVAVHLDRPWPLGMSNATRSPALQLAANLAGDTNRLVLVGDFNRPPWMRDMTALQDSLAVSTRGRAGTWPAGLPGPLRLPLDLVFVGRGLILRNSTPGPDLGSAHLPIIAEIAVRKE